MKTAQQIARIAAARLAYNKIDDAAWNEYDEVSRVLINKYNRSYDMAERQKLNELLADERLKYLKIRDEAYAKFLLVRDYEPPMRLIGKSLK